MFQHAAHIPSGNISDLKYLRRTSAFLRFGFLPFALLRKGAHGQNHPTGQEIQDKFPAPSPANQLNLVAGGEVIQ